MLSRGYASCRNIPYVAMFIRASTEGILPLRYASVSMTERDDGGEFVRAGAREQNTILTNPAQLLQ